SPLPVAEARERLERSFDAAGAGITLEEFSKPVICRNGHRVGLRRLEDQWFLRYSDPEWKLATHAMLPGLRVAPEAYARELPGIIDWFEDRPCTRRGRWLGTPLPSDPSWIIEPIADSTFYPAYFVVRRYVSDGRLRVEQLTPALFDRVFLGKGGGEPSVPEELQRELREEFEYWYPLDLNVGGKEHKRVHFPAFLFTHAKLLPRELQPRGIFVHWWLVGAEGTKISKKDTGVKGGTPPPLEEAWTSWGADALRLYYLLAASPDQDVAWDPTRVDEARDRIAELERLYRSSLAPGEGGPAELEAWLEDAVHELLHEVAAEYESLQLRDMAQQAFITLPALVRRFLARGGRQGEVLARVTRAAIALASPVTPHVAEELGSGTFSGLVASEPFPVPSMFPESPAARAREAYLGEVEEDLHNALRPMLAKGRAPKGIAFYVASPWKRKVDEWIRQSTAAGSERLREVMARTAADPSLASARGEVAEYAVRFGDRIRSEPSTEWQPVDELRLLRSAEAYLAHRFNVETIEVHEEALAEPFDPMKRRQRARPHHPAFYLIPRAPA
ncbi:MAG: class I tRNA ligase family protein, partial [Thermoplasmata archaeon]|nr:class I tRNA ligase family protein [Thermoplasmata archaeon]